MRLPPLSILDLVPVPLGSTPGEALRNSLDLARNAEMAGFRRYWVAEHHNLTGIASSATAVVIGHIAAGTRSIRVGSGGIMLPNHAPLLIAEQFGTLASLFPDRIDLGLGRAPGTDQATLRALRRSPDMADRFPDDVMELLTYLEPASEGQRIRAVPGAGTRVPVWILGSSLTGAQIAAALGLPFAFASHFAPDALLPALATYRAGFRPSRHLARPYAIAALNVIAADTDAEARRLFTTAQQGFTNLARGTPGPMRPPIDEIESYWSPAEKAHVSRMLACSVVGGPETVRSGLAAFAERTGADELILAGAIFDHRARVHSFRLAAEAAGCAAPGDADAAD